MDTSTGTGMRYVGYYYEVKGQVKFSMLGNISIPWRDGRITIACKPFGWMFYLFEGAPHKPPKSFKLERWRVQQLSLDNDCLKIEFRPDAVSIYVKMAEGEKNSEPVKLAFNLIEKILKEDSFRSKGRFGPYPERDVYEAQRVLQELVQQSRSRNIRHILQKAEGIVELSDLSDVSDTDLDDDSDVPDKNLTDKGSVYVNKLQPSPLYAVDSIYQAEDLVTSIADIQSGSDMGKKLGESSISDQGASSASESDLPGRKRNASAKGSERSVSGETESVLPERKRHASIKGSERSMVKEKDNVLWRKAPEGTKKISVSNELKRKSSKLDSSETINSKVRKMEAKNERRRPVNSNDIHLSHDRESQISREPATVQSGLLPNYQCSECNMKFQSVRSLTLHLQGKHGIVKPASVSSSQGQSSSQHITTKQSSSRHTDFLSQEECAPQRLSSDSTSSSPFNCSKCSMKFLSIRSLNIHLEAKHGHKKIKYADSSIPSTLASTSHPLASEFVISDVDVNSTPSKSASAEKSTDKSTISDTVIESAPQSSVSHSSQVNCSKCSMKFLSIRSLNVHLEAKHGIKKYMAVDSTISSPMPNADRPPANRVVITEEDVGSIPFKSVDAKQRLSGEQRIGKPTETGSVGRSPPQSANSNTSNISQVNCTKCSMKFLSIRSLNVHLEAKHGIRKVKAADSSLMPNTGPLSRKLLVSEDDVGSSSTPVCANQSTGRPTEAVFVEHSAPHSSYSTSSNGSPINCSKCQMTFLSIRSLNIHLEAKHGHKKVEDLNSSISSPTMPNAGSPLTSKLVNSEIADSSVPNETFLTSSKKEVTCSECDMMFLTPRSLTAHKANHGKGNNLNEVFASENRMLDTVSNGNPEWQHGEKINNRKSVKQMSNKQIRKQEKLSRHKCQTCGVGFKILKHLKKHIEKHGSQNHEFYYMCSLCGHIRKTEAELRDHLRRKNHSVGKGVICQRLSDHSFCIREILTSKYVYLPNLAPDTDLIPICSICGDCFLSIFDCQTHMKRIHKKNNFMLGKVIERQTYAKNFEFCNHCKSNDEHNAWNCIKFSHQKYNGNTKVIFCCPLGCVFHQVHERIQDHIDEKHSNSQSNKKEQLKCRNIPVLLIQVDHNNLKNYMENKLSFSVISK